MSRRDPYLDFESSFCGDLNHLFQHEEDPQKKEVYRQLTLKIRIAARDAWVALGNELPYQVTWEQPTEAPFYGKSVASMMIL
jgi:hypothetical protein